MVRTVAIATILIASIGISGKGNAAELGDPGRLARPALEQRRALRQPPIVAWATVSGAAAPEFITRFGESLGVEVTGTADGVWRVRSDDRDLLLDALAAVERPAGRLRIAVDPLRA